MKLRPDHQHGFKANNGNNMLKPSTNPRFDGEIPPKSPQNGAPEPVPARPHRLRLACGSCHLTEPRGTRCCTGHSRRRATGRADLAGMAAGWGLLSLLTRAGVIYNCMASQVLCRPPQVKIFTTTHNDPPGLRMI